MKHQVLEHVYAAYLDRYRRQQTCPCLDGDGQSQQPDSQTSTHPDNRTSLLNHGPRSVKSIRQSDEMIRNEKRRTDCCSELGNHSGWYKKVMFLK